MRNEKSDPFQENRGLYGSDDNEVGDGGYI